MGRKHDQEGQPTPGQRRLAAGWLESQDPELAAMLNEPGSRKEKRERLVAFNAKRRAAERAAPDHDLARWERLMTPALTEQEWDELIPADARELRRQGHQMTDVEWQEAMQGLLERHILALAKAKRWDAVAAVANYALADDHPGKLTRADVQAASRPTGDGLATLAAKIAGQLPPETDDDAE
jgi:hypothetical protein